MVLHHLMGATLSGPLVPSRHCASAGMAVFMVVVSHFTAPSVPMAKLLEYLAPSRCEADVTMGSGLRMVENGYMTAVRAKKCSTTMVIED